MSEDPENVPAEGTKPIKTEPAVGACADPLSPDDLAALERLWRSAKPSWPWLGWTIAGDPPSKASILRKRVDMRRLTLVKISGEFQLHDETRAILWRGHALDGLEAALASQAALEAIAGPQDTQKEKK